MRAGAASDSEAGRGGVVAPTGVQSPPGSAGRGSDSSSWQRVGRSEPGATGDSEAGAVERYQPGAAGGAVGGVSTSMRPRSPGPTGGPDRRGGGDGNRVGAWGSSDPGTAIALPSQWPRWSGDRPPARLSDPRRGYRVGAWASPDPGAADSEGGIGPILTPGDRTRRGAAGHHSAGGAARPARAGGEAGDPRREWGAMPWIAGPFPATLQPSGLAASTAPRPSAAPCAVRAAEEGDAEAPPSPEGSPRPGP